MRQESTGGLGGLFTGGVPANPSASGQLPSGLGKDPIPGGQDERPAVLAANVTFDVSLITLFGFFLL